MDTGSAPTSGFVALYAIYNPTTGASALLAKNATSAVQAQVYGGANMPAGYTASALVSVWPTDSTGKLRVGYQDDRRVSFPFVTTLSVGTATSYTSFSLAAAVPPNARSWSGNTSFFLNGTAGNGVFMAADGNGTGLQAIVSSTTTASAQFGNPVADMPIITPQQSYYQNTTSGITTNVTVSSYRF
jgi:hypothetical protein